MSIIEAGMISLLTLTGGLPEVMWLGDPVEAASAAAHGMGDSQFMQQSPLGILNNPALLGISAEGLGLELSAGTEFFVEKRTRLVYDSFESSIGESEIAFNKGIGFFPGGAAVSARGIGGFPESIAFAAGWRVPSTFGYEYGRIVRNASYVKTGEEQLSVSGLLSEFDLAVAFMPTERLTFGLSGGYITGSRDVDWTVTHVDPSIEGEASSRKESISGLVTRGSLLFALSSRVYLGAGLEYPMALSVSPDTTGDPVDWNTLSDQDYDLDRPMEVRLGALYIPGNILRSRVTGEFYWSNDGSLEFEEQSLGLSNSWGVRAGVENTLPGGPVARFGFSYDRSPIDSELDRMGFTAGMGFAYDEWNIDLGASFSPDRWKQTQIPGLPSFSAGDSLTVEETATRVMISLSRSFDL